MPLWIVSGHKKDAFLTNMSNSGTFTKMPQNVEMAQKRHKNGTKVTQKMCHATKTTQKMCHATKMTQKMCHATKNVSFLCPRQNPRLKTQWHMSWDGNYN